MVVARFHATYYDDIGSAAICLAGRWTVFNRRVSIACYVSSPNHSKVVTIAALSVVVLATGVWAFYAAELARPSDAGEPVMLTVFEDQTDVEVADELAAQGLIRSTLLFQGQFKISGGALIPGTYTLRKGMSVPQIVDRITGAAPAEDVPAQAAATAPSRSTSPFPRAGVSSRLRKSMSGLAAKVGRRPSWTPSRGSIARSSTSWRTCPLTQVSKGISFLIPIGSMPTILSSTSSPC